MADRTGTSRKEPCQNTRATPAFADAIIPGLLYLGDAMAAYQIRGGSSNVRDIVNVTPDSQVENMWEAMIGYRYLRVPVLDNRTARLGEHFERICAFIDAALAQDRPVLIHCQAGISRSPTVAAAYIMHRDRLSADAALERVIAARPIASPTTTFREQLWRWEQKLRERDSRV